MADDAGRGFRPAFVLSLVAHAALAVWVVIELGLAGSGGRARPRQARIESELDAPTALEAPRRIDPPGEIPDETPTEPEAPEPRIDDDLVLPAPWHRPIEHLDRPEGEPREDLKRSSIVVARSRRPPRKDDDGEPAVETGPENAAPERAEPAAAVRRIDARKIPGECPSPGYPVRALRRGLEGRVVMIVDVGPEGDVLDVRLQTSSGHDLLDRAALEAVRCWRFRPAREDDRPVRDRVLVPISFRLPRR